MGSSRVEDILQAGLDGTELPTAVSRVEILLKEWIEQGGNIDDILVAGSNITLTKNLDGTITIAASGEVSSEDTVARADIAAIKDGETLDSFGDVESALDAKANSADVYSKTAVDTALNSKADKSTTYTKTEVDTALSGKQNAIDSSHKLSADLVDDTNATNKFATAAQLEEISTTKSVVADMVDGSFKNLIPVTRDDIKSYNSELTWNGYSATYHGLTYTLNADGTIRLNGTIGSTREFHILPRTVERTIFSEAGEYEFYCNVPNSGQIFCGINRTKDGTGVRYGADDGEGLDFEVAQSDLNLPVGIWIGTYETGGQIDCTLKPMVCKKSVWDTSHSYEPYRPTYDNLTSQVKTNQTNISSILDGTTLDSFGDVETALSGKQATLTTAQLAAVNSGIDSTKVAQISTNQTNILTLANYGGGINKLNPVPMFTSGQYAVYNATTNTYGETAGHLDTYSNLRFMIQACTGTTSSDFTVVSTLVNSNITQNGTPAWLFTKLSTFNRLYVGHNGSQTDCKFFFDVSNLEDNQKYYLCVNITNYTHANNEPFTWKNVMVLSEEDYLSGLWQVYQPYALPNFALTQGVLWNTNNGVKNFATENNFSNTGYYKDVPVDGSLTGEIEVYIGNITSTDTDSSKCAILYIYSDGTSSPSYLVDRGTSTTLYGNLESNVLKSIRIYPSDNYVHSSGDTVTVTNLMVCPKFLYDTDSTYEPYSLPNTKITPELIELVDSGAKNLLQNQGVSKTANNVTFTVNSDGSVTVSTNGAASASTSLLMTSGGYIPNDFKGCIISGAPSGTDDGAAIYIGYSNSGSSEARTQRIYNGAAEVVRGDYPYLYITIYIESGKTISTPITFKPMICSKAAWDVSQKFVPYRPSYEETVEQVAENKNNILIENVTSHFTAKTGFTIQTGYTKIFKQGMHIFGKMVVKKDSGTFNNNTQEQIVETDYQMNSQYFSCAFADDLYRCNNIGYCFMGVSGSKAAFTVRDTVAGSNNYVVLSIDFIVQ